MISRKANQANLLRRSIHCLTLAVLLLALSIPVHASDLGLTEADCRCCHGTTLADRHHMLVNSGGLECLSCHDMVFNQATLQYVPVITRDCLQCHTGSLADRHHALVDQVTYDCFSCHTLVWNPATLSYFPVLDLPCPATSPSQPSEALGTVNGTVTDPNGSGLGWAMVSTTNGTFSTLSTATGSYQLADLPDGDYTLAATLDGYVTASRAVTIANGNSAVVDFFLAPLVNPGSITGTVRDANLAPVSGATVSSANGLYSVLSATDGTFLLPEVAEGSYVLTAAKPGYETASQNVTVAAGQGLVANFVLPDLPVEICSDGIDNDNNGLVDCADATCSDALECQPPATEICGDGIDNDANGLIDCGDPVCMGTSSCPPPAVEICGDGLDNNGDGLLDCADPVCSTSTRCLPENCTDGLDNNGDSLVDCADPLCAETSKCLPPPVEICDDGLDNDADGQVDCADAKCASKSVCAQPVIEELCSNGIDDNDNGYTDCADTQCMNRSVCLAEICGNSLDDDGDGLTDCADSDCVDDPACAIPQAPQSLPFTTRASDSEYRYGSEKAADGDMSTRWWVDHDHDEWLRLDLEGIFTINGIDIHWHSEHAEEYKVKVSKDGRYWTTVKEIDHGEGGLDSLAFSEKEARFILIDCEDADHDGFSINEIEVYQASPADSMTGPDEAGSESTGGMQSEPSNENLALNSPTRASDSEYRYEPYKAVDGNMSTRWEVHTHENEWLRVDLGSLVTVSRVVIYWHSQYAEDYQVKVSRDGYHWTTVMEIGNSNGGQDTLTFAAREARYLLIDCENAAGDSSSSDADGFSIYELEVYRQ